MHNVSFGLTNQPYNWGSHGVQGTDCGHHHGSCGMSQSAASSTLGSVLSNLSNSVSSLRSQLDSLATNVALPESGITATGMGAEIISKQRGELQIHTQDGDMVTLKFSNKLHASIDTQQVSDGTTTLTDSSLEVSSRSRIGVSVEGDLSDEELSAINDLVGKVGELTNDFFSGDLETALSQAMNLSYDTTQLADFSLDLSLKQSVSAYAYGIQFVPATVPANTSDTAIDEPVAADPLSLIDILNNADEPAESVAQGAAQDVAAEPTVDAAVAAPVATPDETADTQAAVTSSDQVATTEPVATEATDPAAGNVSVSTLVADFVAKVRTAFHISATDSSLGFSYEFKAKLLIASIAESAPAEAQPCAETLGCLHQQLGVTAS